MTTINTRARPGRPLPDALTMTRRKLLHARRSPFDTFLSVGIPIMFVLLFGYVFGTAMAPNGQAEHFRAFLVPGMLVMAMTQAMAITATNVAADAQTAVMGRFRSLPMASSAPFTGHVLTDLVRAVPELLLVMAAGLVVGWRWEDGVTGAVTALGVLLLFRLAATCVGIYVGLLTRDPDTASMVMMPLVFPVMVLSTTFVDPATMPGWLGTVAEWNPVSAPVNAARELFGNPGVSAGAWPTENALLAAVVFPVLIATMCGALAIRQFRMLRD